MNDSHSHSYPHVNVNVYARVIRDMCSVVCIYSEGDVSVHEMVLLKIEIYTLKNVKI